MWNAHSIDLIRTHCWVTDFTDGTAPPKTTLLGESMDRPTQLKVFKEYILREPAGNSRRLPRTARFPGGEHEIEIHMEWAQFDSAGSPSARVWEEIDDLEVRFGPNSFSTHPVIIEIAKGGNKGVITNGTVHTVANKTELLHINDLPDDTVESANGVGVRAWICSGGEEGLDWLKTCYPKADHKKLEEAWWANQGPGTAAGSLHTTGQAANGSQ